MLLERVTELLFLSHLEILGLVSFVFFSMFTVFFFFFKKNILLNLEKKPNS